MANEEKPIGVVTHYYGHLGVAIIKFDVEVKKGETVRVKGANTDFTQTIDSMQYEHKDIEAAKKGMEVGVRVKEKTREHDRVFRV